MRPEECTQIATGSQHIEGVSEICAERIINITSSSFNVSNGVKQGSVISPLLFTLYVEELITRLEGCVILQLQNFMKNFMAISFLF